MKEEYEYWKVWGHFKGDIVIPRSKENIFPIKDGSICITKYCKIIHKNYPREPRILEVYIKTKKDTDHVYTATMFCEKILTAIVLAANIPCEFNLIAMDKIDPADKQQDNFIYVDYVYRGNEEKWEPYLHKAKGSHIVRFGGDIKGFTVFDEDHIEKIRNKLVDLDKIDEICLQAIDYFKMGMRLVDYWKNEAFLSFFKVIEYFKDKKYSKEFKESIKKKIESDFFKIMKKSRDNIPNNIILEKLNNFIKSDFCRENILLNEEILKYICNITYFYEKYIGKQSDEVIEEIKNISVNLTKVRDRIAHPYSEKEVTKIELQVCKDLAKHLIDIHIESKI